MITNRKMSLLMFVFGILFANSASGAQHDMPPGMTHEQHLAQMKKEAEMKKRGSVAMGFDQDKTTHHFWLTRNGGIIEVESNNPADIGSRDLIRSHLKAISEEFAKGDFSAPLMTHSETPPGVPQMRRLKSAISYMFQEKPQGAAVRISSANSDAVKALHEFLRYQIKEHATGDPLTIEK
jgi:hypothetical protein